ncbi:hypothetical protein LJC27_07870 [Christensenellaceae bacterium OttesenSCG-928-M15]|nr:hypothetical protein [Christensenellaceae bacterium OttesenSCG-928-M15]
MIRLQDIIDNLLKQYEGYFNIERSHMFGGREAVAYARFEQRMAKYVLVKRAQMYAYETNEHVFFVFEDHLDNLKWEFEKKRIIEAEKDYVQPHKEHMYSYMTLVLLANTIDESVKKEIKKLRYTKNYRWSLHGYSTVRVAAAELSSEEVFANVRGKELQKVLDTALHM